MLWQISKTIQKFKKIIAVKTPSFIKQVNCKEIVDKLYNEVISDNPVEDLEIKKILLMWILVC